MLSLFIIKELTSFLRNRRLRINRTEQQLALPVISPISSDPQLEDSIIVQNNGTEISKPSLDYNIAQGEAFLSIDKHIAEVKDVKSVIKIENCCITDISTKIYTIQDFINLKNSISFSHTIKSEKKSVCEKKHEAIINQNLKMIKNNEKFYIKIKKNTIKNIGTNENENISVKDLINEKGFEKDIGNDFATDFKKLETDKIIRKKSCVDNLIDQKKLNEKTVETKFNKNKLLYKDDLKSANLDKNRNENFERKLHKNFKESTYKPSNNTKNISGDKSHLINRHQEKKIYDLKSLQKSNNVNAIRIKENKNQNIKKEIYNFQKYPKKKNIATSQPSTEYSNDFENTKIYLSIF